MSCLLQIFGVEPVIANDGQNICMPNNRARETCLYHCPRLEFSPLTIRSLIELLLADLNIYYRAWKAPLRACLGLFSVHLELYCANTHAMSRCSALLNSRSVTLSTRCGGYSR